MGIANTPPIQTKTINLAANTGYVISLATAGVSAGAAVGQIPRAQRRCTCSSCRRAGAASGPPNAPTSNAAIAGAATSHLKWGGLRFEPGTSTRVATTTMGANAQHETLDSITAF